MKKFLKQTAMNEKKEIVVFSSAFESENGQAVVTRRVVQSVLPQLAGSLNCIYCSGANFRGIFSWAVACLKLLMGLFVHNPQVFYVVCSRTAFGFLRDLPALIFAFCGKRV